MGEHRKQSLESRVRGGWKRQGGGAEGARERKRERAKAVGDIEQVAVKLSLRLLEPKRTIELEPRDRQLSRLDTYSFSYLSPLWKHKYILKVLLALSCDIARYIRGKPMVFFHNKDGKSAIANIKQALGYIKAGDGDGNSQHHEISSNNPVCSTRPTLVRVMELERPHKGENDEMNAISIFLVFHKTFCGKQAPTTKRSHSVWEMEDGVPKLFKKLFTFKTPDEFKNVSVLGFRKSGEAITEMGNDLEEDALFVYKANSEKSTPIGITGKPFAFSVSSYMETLITKSLLYFTFTVSRDWVQR
ncbi:hypothetical protein Tco_0150073 [Tanacetum coccineum]